MRCAHVRNFCFFSGFLRPYSMAINVTVTIPKKSKINDSIEVVIVFIREKWTVGKNFYVKYSKH